MRSMNHVQQRTRTLGRGGLLVAGAIAALLAVPLPSSAATITGSWQAKIGSGGANGSASVVSYLTGTGAVTVRLAKLKPSTVLPVAIYKGTCGAVGGKVVGLASIRTTSKGAATRTSALTAAQTKSITSAAAAGRLAIRIGSGSAVKCGAFTAQAIAPYVAATITVGKHPHGVAIAPSGVWVTNWWDNSLSRIDPATNAVLQTLPLTISGNGGPQAIAYAENALWVTTVELDTTGNEMPGSVLRIDPVTGQQLATIPVGKAPFAIATSSGAVWISLYDGSAVVRINSTDNSIVATIPTPGKLDGLAFGFGAVWAEDDTGLVSRIDPSTNQIVASIHTQDTGGYVAATPDGVWVGNVGHDNTPDGKLTKIDPATNSVAASVTVGSAPGEIAYADGSIWVGLFDSPGIVQVNTTTATITSRITVPNDVFAIAAAAHSVWAVQNLQPADSNADVPAGRVIRIRY